MSHVSLQNVRKYERFEKVSKRPVSQRARYPEKVSYFWEGIWERISDEKKEFEKRILIEQYLFRKVSESARYGIL